MPIAADRPYHHGDLRRAVIDTAMAMLHENRGWQFTLREISRRAGVSHAAPYKHFADKASLLTEMAHIGFDRLREALIPDEAKPTGTLRDAFFGMARAYIGFATTNPGLYRLMFSADAGKPADVHLDVRALAACEPLIELLERGQAEGSLRQRGVRGQMAACWGQMHGLALLTLDGILLPEKVGADALDNALMTLLEGLEA